MRLRAEARVGLIAFLALLALVLVYWFFGGTVFGTGKYEVYAVFDDVAKLAQRADVRMAGVRVGQVQDIQLVGRKARIVMQISERYRDSIPADSVARITTGQLIGVGDYYVEILPGSSRVAVKPGGYLHTAQLPRLDDMIGQVQDIVGGLRTSVASVNEVLTNPELRKSLLSIVRNADEATARTVALTQDVQELLAANRPDIDRLVDTVNGAARDLAASSRDIRFAIEHGGLQQAQQALASAGRTAENLEATTLALRKLAEDEKLAAEVRETVSSAHEAAQGAAQIVERIQNIIGRKKRGPAGGQPGRPVPGTGSRLDAFSKLKDGNFRFDYDITFPGKGDQFYRSGLFDIGESTKLNLQLGQRLDPRSAVRYGLYASRLGIGYDRRMNSRTSLQLDLYRPNDPRLEAKLRYELSPNWGAVVGTDDLFGGSAIVGAEYRR